MARIILKIHRKTMAVPAVVDLECDYRNGDTVAESNTMVMMAEALNEVWKLGRVESPRDSRVVRFQLDVVRKSAAKGVLPLRHENSPRPD